MSKKRSLLRIGNYQYLGFLCLLFLIAPSHPKAQALLGELTINKEAPQIHQLRFDSTSQQLIALQTQKEGNQIQLSLTCFDISLTPLWNKPVFSIPFTPNEMEYIDRTCLLRLSKQHAEILYQYETSKGVAVTRYQLALFNIDAIDSSQLLATSPHNFLHFITADDWESLIMIPVKTSFTNSYSKKGPTSYLPKNQLDCYIYKKHQDTVESSSYPLTQNGAVYNFTTNALDEVHFSLFNEEGEHFIYKIFLPSKSKTIVRYDQLNEHNHINNRAFFDNLLFNEDCVIQSGIDRSNKSQDTWDIYLNKKHFEDTELISWRIKLPQQTIDQLEQAAFNNKQPKSEALRHFEFVKMIPRHEGGHYLITERFRPPDAYKDEDVGAANALLINSVSEYGQLAWSRIIHRNYTWLPNHKPIPFIVDQDSQLWFFYMDQKSRKEGGESIYAATVDKAGQVKYLSSCLPNIKLKDRAFLDSKRSFRINQQLVALWMTENDQSEHHIYIVKL